MIMNITASELVEYKSLNYRYEYTFPAYSLQKCSVLCLGQSRDLAHMGTFLPFFYSIKSDTDNQYDGNMEVRRESQKVA